MSATAEHEVGTSHDDQGDYTEEEVEVTDEEEEKAEEEGKSVKEGGEGTSMSTPIIVSSDDQHKKSQESTTPAKAKASEEVKKLVTKSPGASASRSGGAGAQRKQVKLSLTTTGLWTEETFSRVKIVFPTLGVNNETTNDLTRRTRPECRYWKDEIKFNLNGEMSRTIRVFNVPVPFSENPRYGLEFVYLCLPGFLSGAFSKAGKSRRPTVVTENSLQPDENRWWKIANNVTDKFGIGDPGSKLFEPKNIQTYFASTQKGLIVNAELQFYCKSSTSDLSTLTATNPQRISVELIRAYIMGTDQDIELPARVVRAKKTITAGATKTDLASDDVLKRLAALGL